MFGHVRGSDGHYSGRSSSGFSAQQLAEGVDELFHDSALVVGLPRSSCGRARAAEVNTICNHIGARSAAEALMLAKLEGHRAVTVTDEFLDKDVFKCAHFFSANKALQTYVQEHGGRETMRRRVASARISQT